jgi:hypothetical protein
MSRPNGSMSICAVAVDPVEPIAGCMVLGGCGAAL